MSDAASALAIVLPASEIDDALQLFTETEAEAFAAAAVRVREIAARIPAAALASDEDARGVNSLMALAKDATKAVDASRRAAVDPLNERVKAVNAYYRPLTDALAEVVRRGEPLVLAWLTAKRQAQQAAELAARQARLEAEQREVAARIEAEQAKTAQEKREADARATAAAQDAAFAEALAPPQVRGIASTVGSHTIVRTWVAVVSEPLKLPREYLVPDQAAIDEALAAAVRKMRAAGKATPELDIPGVTLEERESLRKGRGVR